MLDDGVGVAVAPGFPDARERLAGNAQGVDHDVVRLDVAQPEIGEVREGLAADVQIATDRRAVAVRDALPEAVRVQLGGMAPEHSVVLGDQVQAAPRLEHARHWAADAAGRWALPAARSPPSAPPGCGPSIRPPSPLLVDCSGSCARA